MDKRQLCEEAWRKKFDEFGLSEKFELIQRDWSTSHGNKAIVKCRTCGNTFSTWGVAEVIKGRHKFLTCPSCGMKSDGTIQWTKSPIHDEAIAFYLQGHTIDEVAEKFNISKVQFECERYALGIVKTQEQRKASWETSIKKATRKARDNTLSNAKLRHVEILNQLGFDYISRDKNKISIRCRKCKNIFELTAVSVTNGRVTCSECAKAEREEQEQKRKRALLERKEQQALERFQKNPYGLTSYQLSIQDKLDVVHFCEVCGKQYTLRERMQSGDTKYCRDNGCCSKECLKKRARKAQKIRERGYRNHKGRARKYGCAFDSSVTLKALIKRNGLRCAICGEMCEPNDHGWTDHTGPKHPTIDHIIPMSKGGGHVWDNVQVAHAICNSIKRDSIEVDAHEAS